MTLPVNESDPEIAQAFIQNARMFLTEEYLPKIERCLEKLTDEQIWWRANPESNSIGNLILHLSGNANQWIVCGLGNESDNRTRQAEFDQRGGVSKDELLSLLLGTVAKVDATLDRFEPRKLLAEYSIQGTTTTALAAIFHVTEHFSMHTGQIILQAKMLAGLDLKFYDFANGKPEHTWHRSASSTPHSTSSSSGNQS
ncbi:MAG TPA: DUF1572 family protein [Pyrinomonadaceae bacterium]|nr:DUF1572 family protein [Pyrinomonadaceae bacterium]